MSDYECAPIYHYIIEEAKAPKMKMINQYLLIDKIGTGFFSKVYLALNQEDNQKKNYYAVKSIHVHETCQSALNLQREIRYLRKFNHPNIIKIHSVLYAPSTDNVYILMEWANCGTLQQAILNHIQFDEKTIASIYIQIALALSYIHSKGIIHRDVKPSNILLFSDGTAKLSDFGISHSSESAECVCGTPSYQSPDLFEDVCPDSIIFDSNDYYDFKDNNKTDEIKENNMNDSPIIDENDDISKDNQKIKIDDNFKIINDNPRSMIRGNSLSTNNFGYGIRNQMVSDVNDFSKENEEEEKRKIDARKGDVWSLGVSMYQTAFGVLPYEGQNVFEIMNMINNTPLKIPENNEKEFSPSFIDLIFKMLNKEPKERLSIEEVIQHPFFAQFQTTTLNKLIKPTDNLIHIKNNRVIQKTMLDIKPFQPTKKLASTVVKIKAIVCPDNYTF